MIEGIKTNLPFLRRMLANERFQAGTYDTRLVDQILADRLSPFALPRGAATERVAALAAANAASAQAARPRAGIV